jgi:acyl carrier protein
VENKGIQMLIEEQVKKIIAEQLGVKLEQVTDDSNLTSDLGADSLDTVELIMNLEEVLEIEIPDDESEQLKTVKEVIEFVKKIKTGII